MTLLIIILTLACAEILLRVFRPALICNTVSEFQYDENVGVTTRPNLDLTIVTDHLIEVSTNDIAAKNYLSKDELLEYDKIIFCVGDSFTEGIGNLTDGNYPFYLDLMLNRNGNEYEKRFAVFNLGIGGYSSMQSYFAVKNYIKKIGRKPDIIIYLATPYTHADVRFEQGLCHRYPVLNSPYIHPILVKLNDIFEHYQIYLRWKFSIARMFTKDKCPDPYPQKHNDKEIEFDPAVLPGLEPLIEFSKRNEIELILSYTHYENKSYEGIKEFAREKNVLFADYKPDLENMIAIFQEMPVRNEHSGGHYRPWVNYIFAEHFANLIRKNFNNGRH